MLLTWHDLVLAWNHAEDMVAVGPLTSIAYKTCPEAGILVLREQKWWDRKRLVGTSKR